MAFPFPPLNNTPKTPKHSEGPAGLPMPRNVSPIAGHKRTIIIFLIAITVLLLLISPLSGPSKQSDRIPFSHNTVEDYFSTFEGHQECGFTSSDLYTPPVLPPGNSEKHSLFCRNRAKLLDAMSGGGRHGFEAPYFPMGCHYRWYSTPEICMILERFDAIVFVGDDMLKHIYSAFNMLLRENIAIGGLQQWELTENERAGCKCDNQILRSECSLHSVMDSPAVNENEQISSHKSPYHCPRTPHHYIPISSSPAPADLTTKFINLLRNPDDSYKPIPVIHTLSLSTSLSWPAATASMDEWVSLADASGRNVPFLWLGPNAAGHLKPPGQILTQGNNALWHYTLETMKEARARELDALGMYNLTLQAGSWDGSFYGVKVALVQAMMIVNWLSRVEST